MSRLVGGIMGLTGFSAALFTGILTGNPATITLWRGLVCMIICSLVGRVLGGIGSTAAAEFIEKYKADRPPPPPPAQLLELQDRRNQHKRIVEEMKRAA